jgi:sugar phosphate isomerase/epimerase
MRISITYLYTIFRYGYPHSVDDAFRSLDDVRKLGFRFLEMEGLGVPFLRALYKRRNELVTAAADAGVHVHNFCVVDPDMVSLKPDRQAAALDRFKMGVELAEMLGCDTLHLASYTAPVRYLKKSPYALGEDYSFADDFPIRIPKDFNWNSVWAALVTCCRACADMAATSQRTVIMEPRVGEIVCSVDSLLRLMEHVQRPNFKANFDTGHFSAQRENVVLALAKLCGRFANIHISDNNPSDSNHIPVGDGCIDWREFFRTLKMMKYDGYLGLDLGMTPSLVKDYKKSIERIQKIASELKFPVEV